MRYTKKIPATDKGLSERLKKDGWKKLKEPSNLGIATLIAVPFMFINGAISIFIAFYLYPPVGAFLNNEQGINIAFKLDISAIFFVFVILIFMAIHEFLHACFIPNVLTSEKTYWGINGIYGFVSTTETIKKGRFLLISIMPFFLLSILLPFVLNGIGLLNGYTILLCLINAIGSSVDCMNMCLVAIQVPNGANIINNGFETYFK